MNKTTSILIVDDEPAILDVYSAILRIEGYEVWQAATGQTGLQTVRERRPDLVLLDVMLPDCNGMDVCRQIKSDAALADVFVVLASGTAINAASKVDGLGLGADDYLSKPLEMSEFLARVRTMVRLRNTTAALRASEQRHRRLVEILPEAVGLIDLQGRFLALNPHGAAMFGYASSGEWLARSVFDLARPEDQERFRADLKATLETGTLRNAEYLLRKQQGDPFPAELSAAVAADADGQPSGIVLVARDTTERKRAEDQIRLLADAVQSTQELICIADGENRFTFANRAFLQGYGYTAEEIMGKTPEFLYSARNPAELCGVVFQQTLRGGWRGAILNRRKDGTEFPISLVTSPIKNSEGRILGMVGAARDITEQIRTEKRTAAFAHLGYRLSAARTREEAADIVLDIGADLFGWDAGCVSLCSPTGNGVIPVRRVELVGPDRVVFASASAPLEPDPLMRRVMAEGSELVEGTEGSSAAVLRLVHPGNINRCATSMMSVPIHAQGAVMGILSIQSCTPRAYSREDLKLLQTLADHCGDALQRIEIADSLRKAEAKYHGLFEHATEGIFQVTPAGRHLSANPALARILGYQTPDELIVSRNDLAGQYYVIPERREELRRLIVAKGSVQDFEIEVYRQDRSRVWISINERMVRAADGTVLCYEGTTQDITERKRGEEQLRKLSRAVEQSPAAVMITDPEGNIEHVNEKFSQVTGYSLDEVRGQNPRILKSGEVPPELYVRLWQTITSGHQWHGEFLNRKKNGERFWEVVSISPILDEAGRITHFVAVKEDITERKWMENLLRLQRDFGTFLSSTDDLAAAAERLLRIALENAGLDCGAVYLVNSETKALELSAQQGLSAGFAKRSWSLAADEVRDRFAGPRSAVTREPVGLLASIAQQLKGEGLLVLEIIPIQYSGEVVAVLSVGSLVQREFPRQTRHAIEALATQAGGAIARIRAEQSLRTSRQVLEKTIHGIQAAVLIVDANTTTIQDCNPAATRIFGHRREEMIGQRMAFLHRDEASWQEFSRQLHAAVKEKGSLSEFELALQRKDGSTITIEQNIVPIRSEVGEIVTWVAVIRDLTERKRIEADLRQLSGRIIEAQEAERQRVARDLHDSVNQIIASAKMRLIKVGESDQLSPATKERLARCEVLLLQALEENRRIAHNLRPTDLDALGLTVTCHNFCRQFQARTSLVVKTRLARFAQRCPPATELNLFRIVQEAFNNIEKHARASTVRLQIAFHQGALLLRIQDDGRGFDPNAIKSVRRDRGGIGLTNIRERAALLGGTCEVVTGPKQGTTITVRVPAQTTRTPDAGSVFAALDPADGITDESVTGLQV